jgi:hypothetical protein
MKLVNPQTGVHVRTSTARARTDSAYGPRLRFSSAWRAGEAKEIYWQAVTRDVPFDDYATDSLTLAAAADLSASPDFRDRRSVVR